MSDWLEDVWRHAKIIALGVAFGYAVSGTSQAMAGWAATAVAIYWTICAFCVHEEKHDG